MNRKAHGDWLLTDHLVASTRIWLASNGADTNWRERALGRLTRAGRIRLCGDAPLCRFASLAKLFADGWRLDYRSPIVRGIYAACEGKFKPQWP